MDAPGSFILLSIFLFVVFGACIVTGGVWLYFGWRKKSRTVAFLSALPLGIGIFIVGPLLLLALIMVGWWLAADWRSGSQSLERGARSVTSEPSIREVAGRYHLSHTMFGSAADNEILSKAKDSYIELNTNGEAILHEVPIVPESMSGAFVVRELRSGSGSFSIAPLGGNGKSEFYGLYLSCGELPDPVDHPRFKRKGQALFLSFEYFDGEFTSRMEFTRAE